MLFSQWHLSEHRLRTLFLLHFRSKLSWWIVFVRIRVRRLIYSQRSQRSQQRSNGCTSYMINCYAAEISGSFTTLHVATLLMGWGVGVGDVNVLVLRTWSIATLLRSLGSFTTLHVATLRDGVGWGGGDVNVPCTSYMIHCYAAEISGSLRRYMLLRCWWVGWGGWGMLTHLVLRTWSIATLLRSLGSFTTLHVATLLMGWGGGVGDVNVPSCTKYKVR